MKTRHYYSTRGPIEPTAFGDVSVGVEMDMPAPAWRRIRPRWLVVLLTLGTGGLYTFYWYYTTWRELKAEGEEAPMHPFGHTVSLFVPILSLFVMYEHAEVIRRLAASSGVRSSLKPGVVIALGIAVNVLSAVMLIASNAGMGLAGLVPAGLMSLLVAWQQGVLNQAWAAMPGGASPVKVHWVEWTVIAVAALFWGLALLGLLVS